jgi:hypothetical protein
MSLLRLTLKKLFVIAATPLGFSPWMYIPYRLKLRGGFVEIFTDCFNIQKQLKSHNTSPILKVLPQ